VPTAPAPDPAALEAERLASAAETALNANDLPAAKREIAALREKKPDYPSLASLSTRLESAEQTAFNGFTAEAENAIDQRNFDAAREAIAKAAAIKDDSRVASLRSSLKNRETPPATPVPQPVAAVQPPAEKSESETPKKPTASTKKTTEKSPEPRRKEEPPKRTVRAETPPEPRPQAKPAVQPPAPPAAPTTTSRPRKPISSIPGS
jgi:hypothetical protein